MWEKRDIFLRWRGTLLALWGSAGSHWSTINKRKNTEKIENSGNLGIRVLQRYKGCSVVVLEHRFSHTHESFSHTIFLVRLTHWRHIKNFQDIKVIENAEPMPGFLEDFWGQKLRGMISETKNIEKMVSFPIVFWARKIVENVQLFIDCCYHIYE